MSHTTASGLEIVATARKMLRTGRAAQIRRAAGITQKELGLRIGVSQATIDHWEGWAHRPTWHRHHGALTLLGEILLELAAELRMEAP